LADKRYTKGRRGDDGVARIVAKVVAGKTENALAGDVEGLWAGANGHRPQGRKRAFITYSAFYLRPS
jgi:hypothetical protein